MHWGPMQDDAVYMAIVGRQIPAWQRPVMPLLQQAGKPGPQAPPLGVQAVGVGAHAPPTQALEQHCDGLVQAMPSTRQAASFGGVAEAHAMKSVPSAHAAPL